MGLYLPGPDFVGQVLCPAPVDAIQEIHLQFEVLDLTLGGVEVAAEGFEVVLEDGY